MRPYTLMALAGILLCSCGPKIIFEEKRDVPQPWKYSDTLTFEYEVADITRPYNLSVKVSHENDFAFENLYVNVTTIFPDKTSASSPLSLELSREDGSWEGACSGKTCTAELMMSQDAYFKTAGRYILKVGQFSRQDSLPGIVSMTLVLTESSKKQ